MRDAVDKTGLLHGVEKLTTAQAAELGHFEMLKHMHLRGRLQHKAALCAAAATGGQLERLHWLRANGCPWNEDTCKCAAMNGQLTVLQRARANGCPWDRNTCSFAARHGHLEALQWLLANGCPWKLTQCNLAAAEKSHTDVLAWINTHIPTVEPEAPFDRSSAHVVM